MENNQYNLNNNSNETIHTNDEYSPKKFNKSDILVFVTCLLLAFTIWCYAHYINDPIIQKVVVVNFVLENGGPNEELSIEKTTIKIYGEESMISGLSEFTIYVDRNDFTSYNTPTVITLEFPEGVHSHTDTLTFELKQLLLNDKISYK